MVYAFLAVILLSVPARAQPVPAADALRGIREDVTYARYDDAIAGAERFLRRNDLSARDRNLGLEVLAIAHLAIRSPEAEAVLRELYTRDPAHALSDPDQSPVVQAAFTRAREQRPDPAVVRLRASPPAPPGPGESPLVEVRIEVGADAVDELRIGFRQAGESRYSRSVMTDEGGGLYRARIPLAGDPSAERRVEYHVLAVAPSATPLARLGSEAEPLSLVVPAASGGAEPVVFPPPAVSINTQPEVDDGGGGGSSRSIAGAWWLWTLVGVVVVGAAVGLYIGIGPPSDPRTGSLGRVSLQ